MFILKCHELKMQLKLKIRIKKCLQLIDQQFRFQIAQNQDAVHLCN